MKERKEVRLHGMWACPFVRWVKIALNSKGISYEYIEENMKNKSQLLLEYNPIHKKVPVLVHNGNPICESLIILQYINETWTDSPQAQLLPPDPYSRSMILFWADFMVNKLEMPLKKLAASQGIEEEKNIIIEIQMNLKILEENMKVIFPIDLPPNCAQDLRMLDILLCCLQSNIKAKEEAFNLKLMEPKKYPMISTRITSLCALKIVEDTAPSHEKLVKFNRAYRRYYARIN